MEDTNSSLEISFSHSKWEMKTKVVSRLILDLFALETRIDIHMGDLVLQNTGVISPHLSIPPDTVSPTPWRTRD
jgi:hypothetical protein